MRRMRGRVSNMCHVPFHLSALYRNHGTAWPLLKLKFDNVMSAAQSPVGRSRLLAVASHSGDFLNAIPCSYILLERASTIRHSASRQRYVLVRQFALPINASAEKTSTNMVFMHGLSCGWSAGRHSRYSAVNDLIKRALASEIPARLEPSCLSRNDGKRPLT